MQLYYRIFVVNTRKQQNFDLICNIFCFVFLNLNNYFILQVEQFILVDNCIVICKKFNCNVNLMFNKHIFQFQQSTKNIVLIETYFLLNLAVLCKWRSAEWAQRSMPLSLMSPFINAVLMKLMFTRQDVCSFIYQW